MNKTTFLILSILVLAFQISNSQNQANQTQDLETTIRYHDSMFWKAFNSCDLGKMQRYISNDLEFYHDKDGFIKGSESFIKITKNNLCSNRINWKLRREALNKTINIYPVNNYGAIISGEHVFYVTENNKPEYKTGIAKFTHIWEFKDDLWKMKRVLSYDHKAPPQNTDKQEVQLSAELLNTFVGLYNAPNTGKIFISKKEHQLQLKATGMQAIIYAQSESIFFHKQNPLTFEFAKNKKEQVVKMIIREKGIIVEEATKD